VKNGDVFHQHFEHRPHPDHARAVVFRTVSEAGMLTLALSKGRIYKDTMPLLAAAGIVPAEDPDTSRKLIIPTNREDVQLLVVRATDVPTYVEYGAADLGVAGKDVLVEYGAFGLYEPLDLGIARCRLMTAAKVGFQPDGRRLRVATKYVRTAQRYFARQGVQAEIIKLYGSMELAPLVGLADCIVDLVETGSTLKANGLEPRDLIMEVSSRLVVNKAAMKMKHAAITGLIRKLSEYLSTQSNLVA
jgi:ATP phosphoribosyltransferase